MTGRRSPVSGGEPVAIVGMACRFPGAPDLAAFWRLLEKGENAVTEGVPGSGVGRVGELYPDAEVQSDACRFGAFIEGIDLFDAEFFRISPVEAQLLDPQQRLMLETSWQAIEDAGIDPERLKGSLTGVYIGISNMDYRLLNLDSSQTAEPTESLYAVSGTSLNTAAGRVAYALGLEGPAMAVDTACSSSLVAVHQAVSALQRGEADVILAGGVQAILNGRLTELRANARMLSPDGQCKAFDSSANGFVRGEGCGIVVLKRLGDAEADGDRIWGVVLGSALNQDGTSTGLTVPNERAQAGVITEALRRAGVAPSEVDYLEAHGTGTEVGDPIELNSAGAVYGQGRAPDRPLLVGSVKTNIGHLEPAAGVAGLMKTVLSMQQRVVPKHLHFRDPNPRVTWDRLPLKIASETTDWQLHPTRPPRAGISAYGWSGTNAHMIVEGHGEAVGGAAPGGKLAGPAGPYRHVAVPLPDPGADPPSPDELAGRPARLLPLSAKSDAALRELSESYLSWLDEQTGQWSANGMDADLHLPDMAWTAAEGRAHFDHRAGVVFRDAATLRAGLRTVARAESPPRKPKAGKVAFAYTGQGGQWVGMGEALYRSEPVARAVLDRCDRLMREERGASLLDVMFGRPDAGGDLHDPSWTQPAIYALECALTALWNSVGIRPAVVVGHSLGEIAAAHTAGVFTLEEGLRFASTRGALMEALPRAGAMAAVFAPRRRVQAEVAQWHEARGAADLCVAVDNGSHQVVSGPLAEVHAFSDRMEAAGLNVRRLRPSPAYHSPLVGPALDDLEAFFSTIAVSSPTVPLVSNVTGEAVAPDRMLDGAYWRRQAGQPVAFRSCVETLAGLDVDAVIEIGPHAVLGPLVSVNWPQLPGNMEGPVVLASLLRPSWDGSEPERADAFLQAVAGAYEASLPVSLAGLFAGEARRRVALPGYPFQRRRHWVPISGRRRPRDAHPLLGARHESPRGEVMFETEMSPSDPAWLNDHQVFGRVVMPGALYGAMAASAAVAEGLGRAVVEDLQLHNPLVFPGQGPDRAAEVPGRRVQLVLDSAEGTGPRRFEIFSRGSGEDGWTLHAEGRLAPDTQLPGARGRADPTSLRAGLERQDLRAYYRAKAATGIDFGPHFRSLQALWGRPGVAVGRVVLQETGEGSGPQIHPLLLDGCFQVLSAARALAGIGTDATYLPFAWDRLWLNGPLPARLVCHARMREANRNDTSEPGSGEQPETLTGDLSFHDPQGTLLGGLEGYTVKRATRAALLSASEGLEELLYEIAWRERPLVGGLVPAEGLAGPAAASRGIGPFADYLAGEGVTLHERTMLLGDLERLSRSYSLAALEELGWRRRRGETVEAQALGDLLGIQPEHTRLVGRLLRLLRDGGLLADSDDGNGYVVEVDAGDPLPDEALADPETFADRLAELHPHGLHELGLVRRSGVALAGGLRGTVDILEVLFRSEGPGVTEYYFAAPASRASNRLLADAVAQIVRDWPQRRRLRVIEVGAGTGSGTSVVLPQLPAECDYMFTDISAGFFAEAESRFADAAIPMEYRPLDIEKAPSDQGFEPHAYDLIIAANVLHATRDLDETLTNCLELLAPSGQLIALENMRGRGWQDITFGLLDGWWRFSDACRPDHAMASPSVWNRALLDAGYDQVGFLGAEGADRGGPFGSSVFLAQGPAEIAQTPGLWVICPDAGGMGMQLARELATRNQAVVLAGSPRPSETPKRPGRIAHQAVEAASRESWRAILAALPEDIPLQGVVHLGAMDGHGSQASTSQLRDDATKAGGTALALVQALLDADISPAHGLWFVTLGAQALERDYLRPSVGELAGAALWGFGRAVAREAAHLSPRMVDLDPTDPAGITRLVDELMHPDQETQVAHRDGARLAARLTRSGTARARLDLPQDPAWRLMPGAGGVLEEMSAEPAPSRSLGPGQVRVGVDAVGVNFLDVLLSMGVVDSAMPLLGEEFCGRITEAAADVTELAVGDRVVGLGFGTFSPEVVTQAELVAPAPGEVSAAALATIPSAFVSAGLSFEMAALEAGDRVLIHTASGGVGLAAVQLAQAAGLEVFATASAPKQEYLRALGIKHVFDSRTTGFGAGVLEATGGAGVNMVLNSLTGPGFIEDSLSCLGVGGSFVEMGRRDIWSAEEMARSRPDVSYSILELDWLKKNEPAHPGAVLRDVMKEMAAGTLRPLAHTRWPITEAPAAMDFMRSARHIGKNVLVMPPMAGGRLRPDRSYLVTGGLGGIGIEVAKWLSDHGAGVIVLNGRRPPDPSAREQIEALRRRGADVRVELADVTRPEAVDEMLARLEAEAPPLAGVIHSVGVLSDGALGNQTWDRFEQVLWPKVLGAWHLHRATSDRDLDLFVLFSSITGVLGKSGQANHAAANTFLDQLASYRRSLGLPGQAIAWGAWSELGEAEEQRARIERQLEASGTGWISPQQGLDAFDELVRRDLTSCMVGEVDWEVFTDNYEAAPNFFEDLLPGGLGSEEGEGESSGETDVLSELRQGAPTDREGLLVSFLQREFQAVLRLPSAPAAAVGFFELGMDSLMAVEFRNRLNRALSGEYVLSSTAVFDYPNIDSLAEHLLEELTPTVEADGPDPGLAAPVPEPPPQTRSDRDGIAVVGMACRFPAAPDLSAFWRLLEAGENAVTDGRRDAGPWSGLTGDPDAADVAHRRGGFVEGIDRFDARFFRISPIEAQKMDPQQRMLLETSWQALEDAAIDPDRLRGSRTGVYVGVGSPEYRDVIAASGWSDSYLGTAPSVAVGRVAFALGLEGPALPVDMACASSLAAVHQAVAALQRGDVDLALVGGVNATLSQAFARFHSDIGMLSAEGRCNAFDAAADGYVRGEGCGVVVLKRLGRAEADGDRIWAVIRGSAVNQNGASAALTVPNGPAQERVMAEALARAGVSPSDVDYLEAHAVGAQLGDPIELNAVASVYGQPRDMDRPLLIGSVKSNIGHIEWAAGIAAFIKTVLSMNKGVIPKSLHLQTPNPNIEWDRIPVRVASARTDWPTLSDRPPLAGVNAFGLSGANAHVLVERYRPPADAHDMTLPKGGPMPIAVSAAAPVEGLPGPPQRTARLLPLSGKSDGALRDLAGRYLRWLDGADTPASVEALSDMAWTAGAGRSHFPHRAGLVFEDAEHLRRRLHALADADRAAEPDPPRRAGRVAFLYTGPASRWVGRGEALYRTEPVARAVLDRCDELIRADRGISLLDVMFGRPGVEQDPDGPAWRLPAVYALGCALTAQWESVGIRPGAVTGRGPGALAAAWAAGVFGLEEGLRLATALGSLGKTGPQPDGRTMLQALEAALADVTASAPSIALVDAVTGRLPESVGAVDFDRWLQPAEVPVDRSGWAGTLARLGVGVVVEIGPDPGWGDGIGDAWPEAGGPPAVISTLQSPSGDGESADPDDGFVRAVAGAYRAGLDIDFAGLFAGEARRRISVPTYAFQRRRHWI